MQLAAFVALAMTAAPAANVSDAPVVTTSAQQIDSNVVLVEDGGDEVGFIDKYIPWHWGPITDQGPLEPEVAENIWVLLIVGAFLGPINAFIPTLIVGDEVQVHDDFMMEQIVGGIIGWATWWVWGLGLYLNAVGYVHRLDRNIKKTRGKAPASWGSVETAPGAQGVAMAF